jgi:hypothetical protein
VNQTTAITPLTKIDHGAEEANETLKWASGCTHLNKETVVTHY